MCIQIVPRAGQETPDTHLLVFRCPPPSFPGLWSHKRMPEGGIIETPTKKSFADCVIGSEIKMNVVRIGITAVIDIQSFLSNLIVFCGHSKPFCWAVDLLPIGTMGFHPNRYVTSIVWLISGVTLLPAVLVRLSEFSHRLRMYLWWSLCTLYLLACQVRVTVGDSVLCRCVCVTSFEC